MGEVWDLRYMARKSYLAPAGVDVAHCTYNGGFGGSVEEAGQ